MFYYQNLISFIIKEIFLKIIFILMGKMTKNNMINKIIYLKYINLNLTIF